MYAFLHSAHKVKAKRDPSLRRKQGISFNQYSRTNKLHFLYSVYCETPTLVAANRHNTHAIYQLFFIYAAPPKGEQVVLETCRGC
jgi:hypothetical protein